MELIILQLFAMFLSLTGSFLIIFKKKIGWLFSSFGLIVIVYINYLVELYFLIIPATLSIIISVVGFFKWKYDERKLKITGEIK